jgi:YggT family protein
MGNFVAALAQVLDMALDLYMWVIIFRAIISWVNPDPYNPIVRFLYRATEPVLAPIRRWLPFGGLGLDLSPLVVLFVIYFLKLFLVRTIIQVAQAVP